MRWESDIKVKNGGCPREDEAKDLDGGLWKWKNRIVRRNILLFGMTQGP
jgi:hypothetical protein